MSTCEEFEVKFEVKVKKRGSKQIFWDEVGAIGEAGKTGVRKKFQVKLKRSIKNLLRKKNLN